MYVLKCVGEVMCVRGCWAEAIMLNCLPSMLFHCAQDNIPLCCYPIMYSH